jgi:hypothetical protein
MQGKAIGPYSTHRSSMGSCYCVCVYIIACCCIMLLYVCQYIMYVVYRKCLLALVC